MRLFLGGLNVSHLSETVSTLSQLEPSRIAPEQTQ